MTLDEAVQQLMELLPDYSGLRHTTADLKNLLEQAANIVAALTLSYEKAVIFTHTDSPVAFHPGVREYKIDGIVGQLGFGLTDALQILHVHLDDEALVQMTPEQYYGIDPIARGIGQPRYWYEFGDYFGLLPMPSAAVLASYRLEITYAAEVGPWVIGESVLLPSAEELLFGYALTKAKLREAAWQDASSAFVEWFELVRQHVVLMQRPLTRKSDISMPSMMAKAQKRRTA